MYLFSFFCQAGGGVSWNKTINLRKSCKSVIKIYKNYIYFTIFYYVLWLLTNLTFKRYDLNLSGFIQNLFLNLLFKGKGLRHLELVIGSMWFMPVYIIVILFIPSMLFLFMQKSKHPLDNSLKVLLMAMAAALFYVWDNKLFIEVAFYSCFFLIGMISCNSSAITRKHYIGSLSVIAAILLGSRYLFSINILTMQNLKFPPTFTYLAYSFISVVTALYFKNIQVREHNIFAIIGRNALLFYFSQGLSGSIIIPIANRLHMIWYLKLLICFSINLLCCIFIVLILKSYFLIIEKIQSKILIPGGKTIDS